MIVALLTAIGLAHAGLTMDPRRPLPGEEVVLTVTHDDGTPVAGMTLRVVHHPGLPTEREVGAGVTDTLGRTRWTPPMSGPADVIGPQGGLGRVHVAWAHAPLSVAIPLFLLVLAGAGATLYGTGRPRDGRP